MNNVLKRAVAIAGLVFAVAGAGLLIAASFDFSNQTISLLSMIFLGAGLLCYLVIFAFKGFPMQQAKEAERKKIEEQYYEKLNAQTQKTEDNDAQSSGLVKEVETADNGETETD